MGNNTAYLASERSEVPVLRLSYIGPPLFGDAKRYVFDKYDALWYNAGTAWKQITAASSTTEPLNPPASYMYINPATGFTYIYLNSAWAAITDEAVPTFVADADGDPGVAGLVPASAAGDAAAKKVLGATGTWINALTAVSDFVADNGGTPGVHGLVPASANGDAVAKKVLGATGTWIDATTAVSDFVADAGGDPGEAGLVPASVTGDAAANKVLLATGAWGNIDFSDVVIDNAVEVATDANVATVVAALTLMGIFTAPA